jgi:predicted DNA-binding transcriptional regulator YafY
VSTRAKAGTSLQTRVVRAIERARAAGTALDIVYRAASTGDTRRRSVDPVTLRLVTISSTSSPGITAARRGTFMTPTLPPS